MVVQSGMAAERTTAGSQIKRKPKAPVGSYEYAKIVKSFAELRAALAAKEAHGPPRPKPFSLQLAEAKPLFADRPLANTPEMARYLDGMRAAQQEDEDEYAAGMQQT